MKFTAPNFYIQHHQASHGGLPPDYLDKELFMCDQCPNVFISKQSLTVHIINVHKDVDKDKRPKEKKCPYCDKMFRRHQNYQEHIIVKHEKNAIHKCDLACIKLFFSITGKFKKSCKDDAFCIETL